MADEPEVAPLPQAVVTRKKRLRISIIWIIPLLAALVAIGIAIQRLRAEGPTITIVLKEANGVEAGKTFIRYKDVRIGLVTAVELSEDYTKVLVKAKIAKHAAGLMVQDAQFWVVEPRISLSGVSGLNTLLSGNYIGFQAGKSPSRRRCTSRSDEPPIITDQPGRKFVLKADTLGSLGIGTPIYYRRLSVGQVAATRSRPTGARSRSRSSSTRPTTST
jgi:paraquat-inducible protein B